MIATSATCARCGSPRPAQRRLYCSDRCQRRGAAEVLRSPHARKPKRMPATTARAPAPQQTAIPGYRQMPIARKREVAGLRASRLTRARCPACGTGLLERELAAHVRERCAGSLERRDAELAATTGALGSRCGKGCATPGSHHACK